MYLFTLRGLTPIMLTTQFYSTSTFLQGKKKSNPKKKQKYAIHDHPIIIIDFIELVPSSCLTCIAILEFLHLSLLIHLHPPALTPAQIKKCVDAACSVFTLERTISPEE